MRDFCLKKGGEEDFIGVIDIRGVNKPSLESFSPVTSAAYRLVIHTSGEVEALVSTATAREDYKQLRSLLFRSVWDWKNKNLWPKWIDNYENLESLRVLKFEYLDFEGQKLPRGLGKLIHLRLLSFKGSCFDEGISPALSAAFNLPFLQTLDLRTQGKTKISNVLGKMKRLRHIYLPEIEEGEEKLRLHGLSELETLDGFVSSKFEIADLTELANLRFLKATVTDNESLREIITYLASENGQNLQETHLCILRPVSFRSKEGPTLLGKILACGNLHKLDTRVKLSKFPPYEEHFLQSLVLLTLWYAELDQDSMETLEKLPQLRLLYLGHDSYVGNDLICHEFGFPQLRDLHLSNLQNLCCWRVDEGGMPNLSRLEIQGCYKLEKIPDGLKYVANLQELIIKGMPATFAKRIKGVDAREGKDFNKIRHVPSITVGYCD